MAWAIKRDGAWTELSGAFTATVVVNGEPDEVRFPSNWPDLATAAERDAIGVAEIVEAGDPAPGRNIVGSRIEGDEIPHRVWVSEQIPLDVLRSQALARVAARRWERQQTMEWGGLTVPADDVTLTRILATVKLAELQGKGADDVVARWKFGPGPDRMDVTLAQATSYGIAIGANLQACFDREGELAAAVLAAGDDPESIAAAAEAPWEASGD